MKIVKIFSLDNGKTMVFGTFLQGDNVLNENSIFIKSYASNGQYLESSCLDIPSGYEISKIDSNGESVIIKLSETKNGIEHASIIQIDDSCNIVDNINIHNDLYSSIFVGYVNSEVFIGTVSDGFKVVVKDFNDKYITGYEFTEDVSITNGFYAENNFYLVGETGTSDSKKDYIVKLGMNSNIVNSWVMDDNLFFSVENVMSTIEGKVYLVGSYFNTEVYKSFVEEKNKTQLSENAIKPIATQAISTVRSYFPFLFTGDYEENPWCSVFMCEIGEDGTLSSFVSPIADESTFGISEINFIDKAQQQSTTYNGRFCIGSISSKIAESKKDEDYTIYCYKFFNDFTTSSSVEATVESSTDCYFGYDAFGRFYVYIGKVDNAGKTNYNLKFFDSFEDFQTEQNKLNVYVSVCKKYKKYINYSTVAYVFIFLLLYITARFYGAEVKRNELKKSVF